MKVTQKNQKVNRKKVLMVSYDISQKDGYFYSEYESADKIYCLEDIVDNNPRAIKNHYLELDDICSRLGFENIHIFFEPSGGYENIFKRLAFKKHYEVNYVSGEATRKARVIESNDDSKSDDKDKRIILTLAQLSKVLSCRNLPETYSQLRQLGLYYEDVSNIGVIFRTQISDIAKSIFPEQAVKSRFLYSVTGTVIIKKFGFNPHKIVKHGYSSFKYRMKNSIPRVSEKSLKSIFRKAGAAKELLSEAEAEIIEKQLMWHYKKYEEISERKEEFKEEMCELYKTLPEYDKFSQIKQISDDMMARMVAETGPIADFSCLAKLMRYAGLNIRIKESGKFKGQNKISKKGRSLLRKILFQIVFSYLIKKGKLYNEYFYAKKDAGVKGMIIMTNIMRKTLKMLYGVYVSTMTFDIDRVHKNNTEYIKIEKAV